MSTRCLEREGDHGSGSSSTYQLSTHVRAHSDKNGTLRVQLDRQWMIPHRVFSALINKGTSRDTQRRTPYHSARYI